MTGCRPSGRSIRRSLRLACYERVWEVRERQELRRAMTEFCYGTSERDVPTYAGSPDGSFGGMGSFAAGVKLGTAMAYARRSAKRLLSYFVR
jgi:hypothetical protein